MRSSMSRLLILNTQQLQPQIEHTRTRILNILIHLLNRLRLTHIQILHPCIQHPQEVLFGQCVIVHTFT
uniref:Uncharacterized protein n=1 Tax=Arcella intermedia TaxID=1963864 RepID=A0A6B2LV92_9EUKA